MIVYFSWHFLSNVLLLLKLCSLSVPLAVLTMQKDLLYFVNIFTFFILIFIYTFSDAETAELFLFIYLFLFGLD